MRSKNSRLSYGIAISVGAVAWIAPMLATGNNEGWDSPWYNTLAYPAMLLISLCLGAAHPERPWRWPVAMVFTQTVLLFGIPQGRHWPAMAPLAPLGLMFFGILAVPCIGAAYLGRLLRSALAKRSAT